MTNVLAFRVNGIPGAQGSKTHKGNGRMVEASAKVAPWRQDVKARAETMARYHHWEQATGPVSASVCFYLVRPKAHYRSGLHSTKLRDNAPEHPTSVRHGDIDKLLRSTFDALTASGVIADDSLIVQVQTEKAWSPDGIAGAEIIITKL